jgi:hypothetical protein
MDRLARAVGVLLLSLLIACGPAAAVDLTRVLGSSHWGGLYSFAAPGGVDFLNEGAYVVESMGSKVIKVYFGSVYQSNDPSTPVYAHNSHWGPEVQSLQELAATPYYKALFSRPGLAVYVLEAWRVSSLHEQHYWKQRWTPQDRQKEEEEFSQLTAYLLETYRGTGKVFVLQHWEGDWAARTSYNRTVGRFVSVGQQQCPGRGPTLKPSGRGIPKCDVQQRHFLSRLLAVGSRRLADAPPGHGRCRSTATWRRGWPSGWPRGNGAWRWAAVG